MVKRRRADAQAADGVARKSAGLDDLVDETCETGRIRAGFTAAGLDLQFLLTERRFRVPRIIVE